SFVDTAAQRQRTQLPHEVVGQRAGLGQEILERRTLDVFHFALAAVARIEVFLEERAKINFVERIFFLSSGAGRLFRVGGRGGAVAFFFAAADFVDQRNGILEFL